MTEQADAVPADGHPLKGLIDAFDAERRRIDEQHAEPCAHENAGEDHLKEESQ